MSFNESVIIFPKEEYSNSIYDVFEYDTDSKDNNKKE